MSETKFLDNLASCFEKLPGVGKKTAQRYAYYIIEKMSLDDVKELSNELVKAKENVKPVSYTHLTLPTILRV